MRSAFGDMQYSLGLRARNPVDRLAPALESILSRHRVLLLIAFSLIYWTATSVLGSARILWNDEISTLYLSRMPTFGVRWEALATGVDSHPPLSYLLTWLSLQLPGPTEWRIRVPSMFGYWLMTLCVYSLLARRLNAVYGAAGAGLCLVVPTYAYAYEARPYALLFGFTALALLCWQRAGAGGRRLTWLAGLALALGLAGVTHYFSALVWVVLGVAEAMRSWTQRRLDWPVWGAFVIGALPLAACLPLAMALRTSVGSNFWAAPRLGTAIDAYRSMVNLAFAPIIGSAMFYFALRALAGDSIREEPEPTASVPVALHEAAAVSLLAAVPFLGYLFGRLTGGFTERYVYHAIIGLVLLLVGLAGIGSRRNRLLGVSLVGVFFGWFGLKLPFSYRLLRAESGGAFLFQTPRPFDQRAWVDYARNSDLPIAATNSVFFSKLQHYAPAGLSERIYYLADPAAGLRYDQQTTGDTVMLLNGKLFGMRVVRYGEFVSLHKRFLIAANLTQPTWLLTRLAEEGATLLLRVREGPELLLEVTFPGAG